MMPRQVGMGMAGSSSAGSLPVNFLQKAGVYVQRIVTTTGNVKYFSVMSVILQPDCFYTRGPLKALTSWRVYSQGHMEIWGGPYTALKMSHYEFNR